VNGGRGAAAGRALAVLVLGALAACGDAPPASEPAPRADPPSGGAPADEGLLDGFPAATFHIERDRFEALDDPPTLAAAEATWLLPTDDVFGVVVGATAVAYPVSMLAYHHVVNDTVEGVPIAVTY
jgi:hypothetical protein